MTKQNKPEESQQHETSKAAKRRADCGGYEPQLSAAHAADQGAPPSNTAPAKCNSNNKTQILRWGIDSLYVSYPGQLYEQFDQRLHLLKQAAQSPDAVEKSQAQLVLGDHIFEVKDKGRGRFHYVLVDNWYQLSLSGRQSKSLPLAYAQISSELLTLQGLDSALRELNMIVNTLGRVDTPPNVSRIDLCVDFTTGVNIEVIGFNGWVTRAIKKNHYYDADSISGWAIGQGGAISARLYNKTLEIRKSHKNYLKPMWSTAGWDGNQAVWRLEFQLKRAVLKELNVLTVNQLEASLDGLWSYASQNWLRLTIPNDLDNTKSRWPIHPLWDDLSSISWGDQPDLPLQRVSKARLPDDDYLFTSGIAGITSFMARENITDFDDGIAQFMKGAHDFHINNSSRTEKTLPGYVREKVLEKGKRYNTIRNIPDKEAFEKKMEAKKRAYKKGKDGE